MTRKEIVSKLEALGSTEAEIATNLFSLGFKGKTDPPPYTALTNYLGIVIYGGWDSITVGVIGNDIYHYFPINYWDVTKEATNLNLKALGRFISSYCRGKYPELLEDSK